MPHDYAKYIRKDLRATYPTPEDLPDGWEVSVLDMFADGASIKEVIASVDMENGKRHMTYKTYEAFKKNDEHFRAVVEYGELLAEVWWTREGRSKLETKEFNHVMWYMNMKNRFGWRDKIEQIREARRAKLDHDPLTKDQWLDKYATKQEQFTETMKTQTKKPSRGKKAPNTH